MSEINIGIYCITSPSGRKYIGQSKNINQRKKKYSRLECKGQVKLHRSLRKYGWINHTFEVIHYCNISQLNDLEFMYIKLHDSSNKRTGLNVQSGGTHRYHSEETKEKIRQANLGRIFSTETICKMSKSKLGVPNLKARGLKRTQSQLETIRKNRVKHICSEEERAKMSFSQKKRVGKLSSNYGKRFSPEWIENIRKSSTGRKHTPEAKAKIAESNRRRSTKEYKEAKKNKLMDEHKQKLRESNAITQQEKLMMIF